MNQFKAQHDLKSNIRANLKARALPQRIAAGWLEQTPSWFVNHLNGRQMFTRDEVAVLAEHLDMSPADLMGGSLYPDQFPDEEPQPEVAIRNGVRALCCTCGTLRLVDRRSALIAYDNDDRRGRCIGSHLCDTCSQNTVHAVLRDHRAPEDRDYAEDRLTSRSWRDDNDRRDLDLLAARMETFGVDFRWMTWTRPTRAGEPRVMWIQFDESKSQWRVEVNAAMRSLAPTQVLGWLQNAWKAIAVDGLISDEWGGCDPIRGITYTPSSRSESELGDRLLDEIREWTPAVLAGLHEDVKASLQHDTSSDESETSR